MQYEFILRLVIAGICGALIGFERKSRSKEAGLRTHFVVCLGSALMMVVSKYGFFDLVNTSHAISIDPSRIAAQVVSGIGFLGAGTIIVQRQSIKGLTTAAGLWSTSGIGLAIGAGMYTVGFGATCLVLIGLEVLDRGVTKLFRGKSRKLVVHVCDVSTLDAISDSLKEAGYEVNKFQIYSVSKDDSAGKSFEVVAKLPRIQDTKSIMTTVSNVPGVTLAELS